MQFLNGKYASAYINGVYYGYGKIGNGWYDDGTAWYFFLNGKKVYRFCNRWNGKRYFIMVNMLMEDMIINYIKKV